MQFDQDYIYKMFLYKTRDKTRRLIALNIYNTCFDIIRTDYV